MGWSLYFPSRNPVGADVVLLIQHTGSCAFMSSIIFCFCSIISWQRSIILTSIIFFPFEGSADSAWTGDQMATAKANARLERMTRFVFLCFFMLYSFLFVCCLSSLLVSCSKSWNKVHIGSRCDLSLFLLSGLDVSKNNSCPLYGREQVIRDLAYQNYWTKRCIIAVRMNGSGSRDRDFYFTS